MIKWVRNLEIEIEEAILVFIILLNIFDFFKILPGDIDYVKKLISWIVLGILLYRLSLVNVFFGKENTDDELAEIFFGIHSRDIDALILISYFSLIIKNLIAFAAVAQHESHYFQAFYAFLFMNAQIIETISFYFGGTILILISIYLATKVSIRKPSLMHIIHEEGPPPKSIPGTLIRTATIFIILCAFFIVVFNLMMEWLAMAVDAPILMIGIFFYLLIVLKHGKKYHPTTIIYKLANIGETFYSKFISLFHYKNTIALGIVGLLVLHALTDLGIYIIPYITGFKDRLYFGHLGPGHNTIYQLYTQSAPTLNIINKFSLGLVYSLNLIAISAFLLIPSFIWYVLYSKYYPAIKSNIIGLIASAFFVFFASPSFELRPIQATALLGVDIITKNIVNYNANLIILMSLLIFILVKLIAESRLKSIIIIECVVGMIFFGRYIQIYALNVIGYYIESIVSLMRYGEYFIGTFLLVFLMIILLFYIGGFGLFIYETLKKFIPNLNEEKIVRKKQM